MIITCKNAFKITNITLKSLMKMSTATEAAVNKSQKITINNQTINFVKVGTGPRNLLCFPGALGTIWSDFKPQVEGLDRNQFTLVAWDPPGYGDSRPPNRHFGVDFYENDADCAQKFMEALGITKYSLLGWSDGGISSIILAAKYQQNVDKLVIWGANSYVVKEELDSCEKLRDISKWSDRMKAPLVDMYTEEGLVKMWNHWCDTFAEIYKNGGDICSNLLKDVNCPTLILHGDKDPMVAPEHPGYLFENIKKAKLHRYPDGKHNIHLKYADDFNKRVTEFLLQ
ncbi:unnamed protein product [Psylliodes chrysocephalus]|uniref:AB hydrolase-1 domain-containing protein n=1 Tax=Psylliodes chrysocephalus TaxID=3402493 RepID=A0A9P0D9W1_9CUCU|nr:unnamed protein product [Psylliodes chrysocephala]